jgi:hypothetical protein
MPNEAFKPAIGDKYAVFGIHLPDAYIEDTEIGAEWKMFREAAKHMYENEDPRFSFTGSLDGVWAKQNWLAIGGKIKLGGYVSFTAEFQTTPVLIRIVGIKDYVNKPYSPEIELSNVTVGAGFSAGLKKLKATEVVIDESKKETIRFAKRGFREARETSKMLENALLNFSGSVNPISVQTMQILLGDESLQFRFVNSKTTPVEVAHDIVFNTGNKILTCEGGIIQHMTLGIDTISSSHAASEYKYWNVEEYNSPPLAEAGKSYYLYAKVSKSNQTGVFLLSETAIAIESVTGYYHLLVAIVNAEYDSDRSIVPLYGYSEILPGRITTKKIVSPDGSTYFDLENNLIGGNIKFIHTGGGYTDVGEKFEEVETLAQQAYDKRVLRVEKWTTPGYDTYRENVPYQATLGLKIFYDDVDETSTINIARFVWMRISDNPAGDAIWNAYHEHSGASVDITNADLVGDTSFICQFYNESGTEILSEQNF